MKRIALWGMLQVGAPPMLPYIAIAQIPHADAYGDPAAKDHVAAMQRKFADEVCAVSPNTRVIIPVWFDPIVVSRSRH